MKCSAQEAPMAKDSGEQGQQACHWTVLGLRRAMDMQDQVWFSFILMLWCLMLSQLQTSRGSPGEAPVHSKGADEVLGVFERITLPVGGAYWCCWSESQRAGLVAGSSLSRLWVTLFRVVADTVLLCVPSSSCPVGLQDRKRKGP